MQSLRTRLVLSHLIPMLVIVPLIGIGLIYALETRVLLPAYMSAYSGNAALVAEITQDQFRIWTDPIYAQTILARVSPRLTARVMLLAADGRLMASTDPNDLINLNQVISNSAIELVQKGQVVKRVFYNRSLRGDALDIWEPVIDTRLGVIGIVRITYEFASISDQFVQQRTLIAGVLLIGLLLGGMIGLVLAVSIDRPLQRATAAVNRLARGEGSEPLPESGPTELRQLAGAVNFLVQRLHNLEENRRHLLANLVHELGRPLGALRSAVQALIKGAGQDPQLGNELLSGMDGELVRLQSLLGELTQLYDQVLGNLELNRQPLNLTQWLSETLTPWEVSAQQKGLGWSATVPENLPVVQADHVRLGQALGNLFSNAVKFTPAGGQVVISAGEQGDQVWIMVQDNGPGIPADEIDKVFVPFYRGGQGKRFVEGMGLGLSIARDLVEAHRGRLELESTPGQGSRFTVWLPKG